MEQTNQKKFFSLKNDYAFTQVMKKEKVLRGFLSAVLGIMADDILSIEVKDRYLDRTSEEGKYGILDIRVKVSNIGDFDIEMQLNDYAYWENRSIFYTSKMYIEDVISGSGYEQCKKIISIGVLGFNLCKDTDYFHSSFHLREDKRGSLYSDILEFHIIELKKLSTSSPINKDANLYKWAQLINAESEEEYGMLEKDPYIEEALKEVEKLSKDPERVKEYEWRDRCLRDYISFKKAAYNDGHREGMKDGRNEGMEVGLKEGLKEGLEEGLKEGLEEGLKEGLKKGLMQGELKKLVDIIYTMLQKNISIYEIAEILEEDIKLISKVAKIVNENPSWSCQQIIDELEQPFPLK